MIKHEAIYKLYGNVSIADELPNGEFVVIDEDGNKVTIDNSAVDVKVIELQAEKQNKENAKVSGNQKLLDLGLTQAEATVMTGYTPE